MASMFQDFPDLDATAQAELVRDGEVSTVELVDAAIARIESANPHLNAVIHERFERARKEAGDAVAGPFRGVPFLVKDAVCHTAGDPFHCGMRALQQLGWTETEDSWLAARFRAAGFVFVGKTNTPELASSCTTEPLAYGPTRNPWDPTRSAGGSSGGSAAAVAAGMVPVAHGNDMGGSIRFPASMCGIVGLKPTRARTTLGPRFGEYWGPLTHEFVLTRSIRDTAAVLDAVSGMAVGDPYTAPAPARRYVEEVGAPIEPLRVGFRTVRRDGAPSHPDCTRAVEATARLLESLGHHVAEDPVTALDATCDSAFGTVFTVALAGDVARWSARTGIDVRPHLEPGNALLVDAGAQVDALRYVDALDAMSSWSRRLAAWWEDHDVLVLPTSPEPPVPLGDLAPDNPDPAVGIRMAELVTFTVPFDVTGQPAISLPLSWNDDGLPIGVQLVARYGREDVLIRLGAQLEAAQPWHDRRPPEA
jgi:amidase